MRHEYPIHGDLFEIVGGGIFMVYGNKHRQNSIYAIPVKIKKNKKPNDDNEFQYYKIEEYRHEYPHYAIPNEKIANFLKWEDLDNTQWRHHKEFKQYVAGNAKIPEDSIKISANSFISTDVACTPSIFSAPYTLNIFGITNGNKWREFFRICINSSHAEDKTNQCLIQPLGMDELKNIYRKKYASHKLKKGISFFEFLKYEGRKLRHGLYKEHHFLIRFFNQNNRKSLYDQNKQISEHRVVLGRATITGQVYGNYHWWTTPSKVEVGNVSIRRFEKLVCCKNRNCSNGSNNQKIDVHDFNLKEICEIECLDERYIENIRLLEHFEVNGTVEIVESKTRSPKIILFVGRYHSDYIKFM